MNKGTTKDLVGQPIFKRVITGYYRLYKSFFSWEMGSSRSCEIAVYEVFLLNERIP